MANFKLSETAKTDILTSFRFEIHIAADSANSNLGLTESVVGYVQSCTLPSAPGEPIVWNLPGGMKNYQAGKRTTQPIELTFVVPSTAGNGSIYTMLEKAQNSCYSLDKGTNVGKAKYCTDAFTIKCKAEDDTVKYIFQPLRAQITNCNYGTLSSEQNDLLRVSMSLVYDNYKAMDGNGNDLKGLA